MQVYLSHTQMLLSLSFCKDCHQHISKPFHPIISMIFLNLKCCHHSSLPADNADGCLLFLAPTQCWGETHNQLCLFPWYVCVRPFNIHHQYSVPSLCFVLALLPDSPASHVWPHTPHSHVLQVGKDWSDNHSFISFIQQYWGFGWDCYCAQYNMHFSCQRKKVCCQISFKTSFAILFQVFWSSKMFAKFLLWVYGESVMS